MVLCQLFLLQFCLFRGSLVSQNLNDFFSFSFRPHFVMLTNVLLKTNIEVVHHFRIRLSNLAILIIVVPVSSLDIIQNPKALIQPLIKHNMMDGFLHLVYFSSKIIFLLHSEVIMMITALSKLHLKILLRLLQLLFILV